MSKDELSLSCFMLFAVHFEQSEVWNKLHNNFDITFYDKMKISIQLSSIFQEKSVILKAHEMLC
jgi:hypothetical protein